MKRLLFSVLLVMAVTLNNETAAQDYKTYISPAYFGPNAFQVPQISDKGATGDIQAIVAGDFITGYTGQKDYTSDIYMELHIPLFTDRVNLSVWGAVHEWYCQSNDVLSYRKISSDGATGDGHKSGALFLSTDIMVLKERKICPAIMIRAALRTASENDAFPMRRGYDCAGYFFDLSLYKTFGPVGISASTGFLCWQTGIGEQNDAVQFGIKARYSHEYFRVSGQYGGYVGWRHDGDCPRVLYVNMDIGPEKWHVKPYLLYQHGFNDWPFNLFRVGVKADVNLF